MKTSLLAVFSILLPITIFFSPVILSGKLPIPADTIPGLYHPMRDVFRQDYPNGPPFKNFLITDPVRQQYLWRKFSIEQFKNGQMPWWNPFNFSGTPHFANFQSASFYPLNLIFWLTDFTTGWTIQIMLQQILGAWFMYAFLKNLKLSSVSSLFGSLTWIFSGHFIAWLEWNTAVHVAIWTPLILLSIDKFLISTTNKHRLRWALVMLVGLSSQFFAGYPQPWLYLSILQLTYLAVKLVKTSKKPIALVGTIYTLFLLVISTQILSTLQFSNASNRITDQGNVLEKLDWFLPYQNIIQVIIPDFFGNPATLNYWGIFNYTEFVSFIGVIPFIFVLVAMFNKPTRTNSTFFLLVVIFSLAMATRNPISVLQFKSNLPLISSSQPSRWIVVTDFALATLAAFGLQKFLKRPAALKKPLVITTLILVSLMLWANQLHSLEVIGEKLTISRRNMILPLMELLFLIGLFIISRQAHTKRLLSLIVLKFNIKRPTLLIASLAILASASSGVRFAQKFTPFTEKKFLYPQTNITSYLQKNAKLFRYMTTDRRIMAPNFNMAYNLYTIEGYDPLYFQAYGTLISAAKLQPLISFPEKSDAFNRIVALDNATSPIIDLLGVKYVLSLSPISSDKLKLVLQEGQTLLYENTKVLPRSFSTTNLDTLEVSDYKPATIVNYTPNKVTIVGSTSEESFLILTDSWSPNWQVKINGQPASLLSWLGLRATIVPEGDYEAVFEYRYPQF